MMTRQARNALHRKQDRIQVKDGVPVIANLVEGVPVIRSTSEGLVEYIKHGNILYKQVYSKAYDDTTSPDRAIKIKSALTQFTASSPNIDSGAISLPRQCIITRLTAVVHTTLVQATATVGVSVGTSAGGTQFTGTLDADGLEASGTSVNAGIGVSTDDVLTAALGGTAILGALADSYRAAVTEVHFRTVASTGAFTAGAMYYIVEYIELD